MQEIREQEARAAVEGLCNPESLEIFQTWYLFGGTQRGLSLEEVLSMPAWLRQDFLFITTCIAEERAAARRRAEQEKGVRARRKGKPPR